METTKIDGDVSAPVTVSKQIARIIEQSQEQGLHLTGEGGLLPDMIRRAAWAALHAEMSGHLGYERHAAQGRGSGNSRNGVTGAHGRPRDQLSWRCRGTSGGMFEPVTVPKGVRRLTDSGGMIMSLFGRSNDPRYR